MMKKKASGFTLIELLVVIAILAILTIIAAPSYSRMMAKNEMRSILNEWRGAFFLAQKEAIRLKHRVELCPSDNGSTCAPDKSNYTVGWIVIDNKTNTVIQDYPPSKNKSLDVSLNVANGVSLNFLNNGRLPSNFAGGNLEITNSKLKLSMEVNLSRSGRISNSN